ncbi:MAG: ATP-dependent zinc metalloprotease FtsH [Actinomycetota bacterium]|nr:ATP-dependent zinc metalloprotease FtsH [Actinomycetota bacterium]
MIESDDRIPPASRRDAEEHTTPAPDGSAAPAAGDTPWRVEGLDEDQPKGGGGGGKWSWRGPRFWLVIFVLLIVNWIVSSALFGNVPDRLRVPYTTFREQVVDGNVVEITSRGDTIQGLFDDPVTYPDGDEAETSERFETERPAFADDELLELLVEGEVIVNAETPEQPAPFWQSLLLGFGPTVLLVGVFVLIARGIRGLGGFSELGRHKAKQYEEDGGGRVTFSDVAGIDEAEQELSEVVDYLRDPGRYRRLGATIPKGVLLSGPPGTGKTLLARAVAGEAGAPFFSVSASEFIEMIVGVGASRVRDLFRKATECAPSIIFIDELDAIGRARGGAGSVGGHDEREQTLNQILTEMDGFTGSEGVIVIAATNRPEILDSALLRPGRFDRRVTVNPPDRAGRRAILAVHTRAVPLDDDVDLDGLAASTPGMAGANLRNLVNEGALLAARRGRDRVRHADLTESLEKLVLGAERRITMLPDERERTAYHESGHALLGMIQHGADPVRKISIIPRGGALGVTFQAPDDDRYGFDEAYLRGRIIGALGGRAAEHVVYGTITTGAESDLEQVTRIARQMVGRWGMSEAVGQLTILPRPGSDQVLTGADAPSAATMELIDREVRRIVDECYEGALTMLSEHRDQLESLAQALLEHETLDEADAYRIARVDRAGVTPLGASTTVSAGPPADGAAGTGPGPVS